MPPPPSVADDAPAQKSRRRRGRAMRMDEFQAQQPVAQVAGKFFLWPEHQPALRLWGAIGTQWREGFNGPTGLDYTGIEAAMRLLGIPRAERAERFAEMRVMERVTLRVWAHRRQQRQQQARNIM